MIIHTINDLSDQKITSFLKKNLEKIEGTDQIVKNYHPKFENIPGNLFYILKEGRYKIGNYFILEDNGNYVGSAGWNQHNDTALLLTRAFVSKQYRTNYHLSNYLLPIMIEETDNFKKVWITCNEYNMAIYHAILRFHQGKSVGLFKQWPKIYSKFKPIGKHLVNYTEQYVMEYKK